MPTLREQFSATERIGNVNRIYPAARSTFFVQDRTVVALTASHREVFFAGDATLERDFTHIKETFRILERTTAAATFTWLAADRFWARDKAYPRVSLSASIQDSFVARDSLPRAQLRTRLSESVTALGRATTSLASNRVVREVLRARGKALPRQRSTVREQFGATEATYPARVLRHIERESFTALDGFAVSIQHKGSVRETFVASETPTATSNIPDVARERFAAIETTYPMPEMVLNASLLHETPLSDTEVWTTDMMSWGMSRYLATGIWDFSGTQFGLGRDGVFTASSDVARLAFLRTGDLTFEDREERILEKKRINYVYSYAVQPGPLIIGVVADHDGSRLGTEYNQPEDAPSTDTRAVRTPIGRGYASNYIQLTVGGKELFDLSGLEVETTVTKRRV